MPGSLMSGLNHEPFRKENMRHLTQNLRRKLGAIWELPTDTFKNKAVVLPEKRVLRNLT